MKVRRLPIVVCSVLGAIVLGVSRWSASERHLDELGERLCVFDERTPTRMTYRAGWLSDREILEVSASLPDIRVVRTGRLNTRTRALTDLPKLKDRIVNEGMGALPTVSPDGRWVACWAVDLRPPRTEWLCAISIDGSQVVRWPRVRGGIRDYLNHGWMPDSKSYIVVFRDRVVTYRLDAPGASRSQTIQLLPDDATFLGAIHGGVLFGRWRRNAGPIKLLKVRLDHGAPTLSETEVSLPSSARPFWARVSPQGDRLVWSLTLSNPPPDAQVMRRLQRFFGMAPRSELGLWVSGLDGKGLREIGHVHDTDMRLSQWVPDGRHVTYQRRTFLHSVRVDN